MLESQSASGVSWLWYVDVEARSVTVSQLRDGAWVEVAVHGDDERVRLQPFAEVELELATWWFSGGTGPIVVEFGLMLECD